MAYVSKIPPEEATGSLKREFDAAMARAGRIWEIVAVQSQNADALRDGMRLYRTTMYGESPLSRQQREMIAVVTSMANECHY